MPFQPALPIDIPIQDDLSSALEVSGRKINALQPQDTPIHAWYRFVLSFPPHLVRQYIDRFDLTSDQKLLDPFCGTGTTLVEAKKLGISSVGIESIPMPVFASRTKVDWSGDPAILVKHAETVANETHDILSRDGLSDKGDNGHADAADLRSLPSDSARLLFKDSISPLPLHKTLVLLDVLNKHHDPNISHYERLALASALVQSISNLKFGPEVGIGKIKHDAPVVSSWLDRVHRIASDLHANNDRRTHAEVIRGDARDIQGFVEPESIDAVITSPPYPNEKDYTRTVRLESVLLGFMSDRSELRETKEHLLRSNTRGVFKTDDDDIWVDGNSEVRRIAATIENRRIELGKTSGFERRYSRVAELYFGGMTRHLRSVSEVLKPGAKLAYVVGDQASFFRIMIRTGGLLADIAAQEGFQVDGLDLFRTRQSTTTGEQLREEVLLLSWRP